METNGCKYTLSSRQPNKKKSTNVNHLDDVIKNIKSESQNVCYITLYLIVRCIECETIDLAL